MFLIGMSAGVTPTLESLCHPKDFHSLLISPRKEVIPFLTLLFIQIVEHVVFQNCPDHHQVPR